MTRSGQSHILAIGGGSFRATERHGFRTPAADELDLALLAAMPRINGRTSRAEYAIVLRTAAGSTR